MGKDRYLTLEEAARDVDRTVSWVKSCICRGELDGKLEGRRWLVSVESLRKIVPSSPPTEPEVIHNFLTPRPPRGARAAKPSGRHSSEPGPNRARRPVSAKDGRLPTPARGSKKDEPKPGRRRTIELRIGVLDRRITRLGNLLRNEMLAHGPASEDGRESVGYSKAAKKLLRQWKTAREERRKLLVTLKDFDESRRPSPSPSPPNIRGEKTERAPAGGIPGYYAGRSEAAAGKTEKRHWWAEED